MKLSFRSPSQNAILSAVYIPDCRQDHATWTIEILESGTLEQEIYWGHSLDSPDRSTREIPVEQMALLDGLLHQVDVQGLSNLLPLNCVDVVAMVGLHLPKADLKIIVPEVRVGRPPKDRRARIELRLDGEAALEMELFRKLWTFCENHAPYSLAKHKENSNKAQQTDP